MSFSNLQELFSRSRSISVATLESLPETSESPPKSPNRPRLKSYKSVPLFSRQKSERLKVSLGSLPSSPLRHESYRNSAAAKSTDYIPLGDSDSVASPRRDASDYSSSAHLSAQAHNSKSPTIARTSSSSNLRKRLGDLIGPPPSPLPCTCPITILSIAASENAGHLIVALSFGKPVKKAMKAVLLPPEKTFNSFRNSIRRSQFSSIVELYLAGKHTEVEDRIRGMDTKIFGSLFLSPNFGDSWFRLEIQENLNGDHVMRIRPSLEYETFLARLRNPSQLGLTVSPKTDEDPLIFIEKSRLTYEKLFSASGLAKLGFRNSQQDSGIKKTYLYVKDLNTHHGPKYEYEEDLRKIYNEIETLQKIGKHPSIILPTGYVTFGPKMEQKIIGYISQYCVNGKLSDYLFVYSADGSFRKREITLIQKAMWAMQIISGIRHLCRFAKRPFGEGLGLDKVLLDNYFMAQLTGFATREVKDRTKLWMMAPEIRREGEWSPREIHVDGAKKIRWDHNFENPPRWSSSTVSSISEKPLPRLPGGLTRRKSTWSAFTPPTWTACPKALEIAEVYALGIVLWALFEQIDLQYYIAPTEIYKGNVNWGKDSIIPLSWRKLVGGCLKENPEERWDLDKVLATMVEEVGNLWGY
ncbi:hypothetical protein RUND412_002260 [Rhizina undulata]